MSKITTYTQKKSQDRKGNFITLGEKKGYIKSLYKFISSPFKFTHTYLVSNIKIFPLLFTFFSCERFLTKFYINTNILITFIQ